MGATRKRKMKKGEKPSGMDVSSRADGRGGGLRPKSSRREGEDTEHGGEGGGDTAG